jgi:hypothetical protein
MASIEGNGKLRLLMIGLLCTHIDMHLAVLLTLSNDLPMLIKQDLIGWIINE